MDVCFMLLGSCISETDSSSCLLPAWKCGIHQQMVRGWSAWRFGRCLGVTGPVGSGPRCVGSVSELHGTGFSSPHRTGNPKSAELSARKQQNSEKWILPAISIKCWILGGKLYLVMKVIKLKSNELKCYFACFPYRVRLFLLGKKLPFKCSQVKQRNNSDHAAVSLQQSAASVLNHFGRL